MAIPGAIAACSLVPASAGPSQRTRCIEPAGIGPLCNIDPLNGRPTFGPVPALLRFVMPDVVVPAQESGCLTISVFYGR
jgi:hypothetical protein